MLSHTELKQIEKLLTARCLIDELISVEERHETGRFDSDRGKAEINERWRRHRERKAKNE
jgi:hypothetical protein